MECIRDNVSVAYPTVIIQKSSLTFIDVPSNSVLFIPQKYFPQMHSNPKYKQIIHKFSCLSFTVYCSFMSQHLFIKWMQQSLPSFYNSIVIHIPVTLVHFKQKPIWPPNEMKGYETRGNQNRHLKFIEMSFPFTVYCIGHVYTGACKCVIHFKNSIWNGQL